LPPQTAGRGDYLITTNIRNEKQFWKRQQIEPYQPVIVIGLDDEKNLFQLGVFYRAHREYSWKSGAQPPMMARPLGAFIHFLKEPPWPYLWNHTRRKSGRLLSSTKTELRKKSAHRRIRWRNRAGNCSLIWLTGCARHAAKRINLRSLGDRQS
jgi:hypothetical protein